MGFSNIFCFIPIHKVHCVLSSIPQHWSDALNIIMLLTDSSHMCCCCTSYLGMTLRQDLIKHKSAILHRLAQA
jgi:hypothetical protein